MATISATPTWFPPRTASTSTSTSPIGLPTALPTGSRRSIFSLLPGPRLTQCLKQHPHALAFEKRYDGWNVDQGLGGYSRDLFPADAIYWGPMRVNWNADLHR